MHPFLILFAATAAPQTSSAETGDIVVTASREHVERENAAVSVTIFDSEQLQALALPFASDALRLAPGVSVATAGPAGSQTQLRIRGAEANHTLLFVDGIRFNDPAAGSNEARFELLTADALSRIELVRGPQSALWGSEALGGVVAVETTRPLSATGSGGRMEYGSLDTARASAHVSGRAGAFGLGGSFGFLRSDGIDAFGSGGERDGFENRTASLKAVYSPAPSAEIGLVGHWIEGKSEFDGYDPVSFARADTLDRTRNRMFALRSWARAVTDGEAPWVYSLDATLVDSRNRNETGDTLLNTTFGRRFSLGAQLSKTFGFGPTRHRVTAAASHEVERFHVDDRQYLGAAAQRRSRNLKALLGEWHSEWTDSLTSGVAVRHDSFSAFADATTVRANLSYHVANEVTLHLGYGEGIAQPTFYDLYGFFPGSFVGNQNLRPESSRGWEAGVRWARGNTRVSVTIFSNRLRDEIVDVFDSETFLSSTANVSGKSRRRGLEAEAEQRIGPVTLNANYTFLDADQQQQIGEDHAREVRRPRHSANVSATGSIGKLSLGAALSYVGRRDDTDFDAFPARAVTLGDYLLASLNLGWRINDVLEAYGRVENGLDADYEDAVGYRTAGRTVYAGLRLHFGD